MARKAQKKELIETKKETIRRRQNLQKKKFLEKVKETPVIQVAAAKTGIDRSTYYRWIQGDSQFKTDSEKALEQGTEFINDMMESILIKNAKADKLTAVIFWLKNHSPQYNDKRYYEHKHYLEQEDVLTDERKAEIAMCVRAWSEPETGDERDEDYEPNYEPELESGPRPKKAKVRKATTTKRVSKKTDRTPEARSCVAKKIVPKRLK